LALGAPFPYPRPLACAVGQIWGLYGAIRAKPSPPRPLSRPQCKTLPSVLRSRHSALWAVAPHPVAAKPLPTGALHLKLIGLFPFDQPYKRPDHLPLDCGRSSARVAVI
jgi:hypothetical protein